MVLAVCLWTSCADTEERALTSAERQRVSQLYADTVRVLTPIVDSTCAARQDELVATYADSLYRLRLADLVDRQKQFVE